MMIFDLIEKCRYAFYGYDGRIKMPPLSSFLHLFMQFVLLFKRLLLVTLPFYPENNSVSTIRIRLKEVTKSFGLVNILN